MVVLNISDTNISTSIDRHALRNRISLAIIIITIALSGIFVGMRSYYTDPFLDDLLYASYLDKNILGSNESYDRPITGLGDAIGSQYNQYFGSNGRTLVHILVQMFNGVWDHSIFAIFNGIQFSILIFLFGKLTIPTIRINNPLYWMLIVISFLYVFQNNGMLWYWVYSSLNYLTPIVFVTATLLVFESIEEQHVLQRFSYIIIPILAFVTGWSHECYSIPLSGGVFFYLLLKYKSYNRNLLLIAIPLWIGTFILTIAPGNYNRFGGLNHWQTLKETISYIRINWNFLFFIAMSILYCIVNGPYKLISLIKKSQLSFITLILACVFVSIAHFQSSSFSGVSYYSCLLAFILLWELLKRININGRISTIASIVLLITISIHQLRIIVSDKEIHKINQQFISSYKASNDGVMILPQKPYFAFDVKPYVLFWFTSGARTWQIKYLNIKYFNGSKPITLVDSQGEIIEQPQL